VVGIEVPHLESLTGLGAVYSKTSKPFWVKFSFFCPILLMEQVTH